MDNLFDLTFPANIQELELKLLALGQQAHRGVPTRALPLLTFCMLSTYSLLNEHVGGRVRQRLEALTLRWMEYNQAMLIEGETTPSLPDDVITDIEYLVNVIDRNKHQITSKDFEASTKLMRQALEMTNQTLVNQITSNYTDALKALHD